MNPGSGRFKMPESDFLDLPTVYRDGLMKDRVVLVSGAGTGIGKATACLFARLGASLVLCGRTEEKLRRTAELLDRIGAPSIQIPMTIRDPEQVEALINRTWEKYGRLDVLINNAGGQFPQDAIDFSVKGWNAVIDTNLNGTWYMMQCAARRWRDENIPGCIVNIVVPFQRGMPGVTHTVAARSGVVFASRNVALEWAPYKIRVNCIVPGPILTEGMDAYSQEAYEGLRRSNLMKRYGDVQDIAEACVYLSAASGKFITGEFLTVDGGYQIWGEMYLAGQADYFGFSQNEDA